MRVSRPVLRGPAGVTPVGYSPTDVGGRIDGKVQLGRIRSAAAMPMRGALSAAVVVTQHVAAEITFEVAPHRVDVVAARVVELDQEVRALDAKVVRLTRLIRSSPADFGSNRAEPRAHARVAPR